MPDAASSARAERPVPMDTLYRAETPEGITLALRPAGAVPRGVAYSIDWLLRMALLGVLAALLEPFKGVGQAMWLLLFFGIEWFYPVLFELMPAAATPGKLAVGLRVVMDDGLPVTVGASVLRNLLRVADFLPFMFGLGLASMLCRHDFKRLGDLAARTLVVYRADKVAAATWPDVPAVDPGRPLGFDQQRALLLLAGRAHRLTAERVEELAGLAAPSLSHTPPSGSPQAPRVLGVARWLHGQR